MLTNPISELIINELYIDCWNFFEIYIFGILSQIWLSKFEISWTQFIFKSNFEILKGFWHASFSNSVLNFEVRRFPCFWKSLSRVWGFSIRTLKYSFLLLSSGDARKWEVPSNAFFQNWVSCEFLILAHSGLSFVKPGLVICKTRKHFYENVAS